MPFRSSFLQFSPNYQLYTYGICDPRASFPVLGDKGRLDVAEQSSKTGGRNGNAGTKRAERFVRPALY
ncbi:hypothetical protein CLOSTMETH_03118 [[Clostridium] methylpentosum DSM 5476]|uniref:Uncharacterized protein n=1 Tax=[Clostridium] methylpentosum DSM 5476 TaxID=537013 RepID=C0EGX5_9FIRM|nr:hypothetical protein CLOSTMETH_03118 [[Clostridium] methylpentosum DSM 5476]